MKKKTRSKVEAQKLYSLNEAVELVKALANAKFDEPLTLPFSSVLILARATQAVRGAIVMPAGTGKTVRVAVFAQGAAAEAAKEAGADVVGLEDLVHQVKAGEINFDIVIAEPSAMRFVGQVGQILARVV